MQMTREELISEIQVYLNEKIWCEIEEVVEEADLQIDLGADYLDFIEIIMDLEVKYNIAIPDKEANLIKTVGHLVSVIHDRITTKPSTT